MPSGKSEGVTPEKKDGDGISSNTSISHEKKLTPSEREMRELLEREKQADRNKKNIEEGKDKFKDELDKFKTLYDQAINDPRLRDALGFLKALYEIKSDHSVYEQAKERLGEVYNSYQPIIREYNLQVETINGLARSLAPLNDAIEKHNKEYKDLGNEFTIEGLGIPRDLSPLPRLPTRPDIEALMRDSSYRGLKIPGPRGEYETFSEG